MGIECKKEESWNRKNRLQSSWSMEYIRGALDFLGRGSVPYRHCFLRTPYILDDTDDGDDDAY